MPSTRSQPLNPRLVPALPVAVATTRTAATPPANAAEHAAASDDPVERAAEAARAGGFHESSYELRNGLEVNESEWPADITIPGALGDR
jgi:hypothetical protein